MFAGSTRASSAAAGLVQDAGIASLAIT